MDRKAQFFIISTIIITTTLVSLQGIFSGYGDVDTSMPSSLSEDFIFNNIKNELSQTYNDYECPDVETNLKEFSLLAERFTAEKGLSLVLEFDKDGVCNPGKTTVEVNMSLESFNGVISDVFNL